MTQYDDLAALTAEYQRALRGRNKWQEKVDAAQREIDTLMAVNPAPVPVVTPAPVPAPAPAPEFTDPAPAPVAQ